MPGKEGTCQWKRAGKGKTSFFHVIYIACQQKAWPRLKVDLLTSKIQIRNGYSHFKWFNWGEKSQPACEWYCSMGRGSILKERWLEDKILSSSRALGTSTFWFIWASTQPSATRSFLPWYTVLCQPVNRNKSFLSKLLPVRPLTTAMRKVTYYRHSRSLRLENQRNSCSVSWSSQPLDFFS